MLIDCNLVFLLGPIVDPVGPRPGGAGAPTSAPRGNIAFIHLLIFRLFPKVQSWLVDLIYGHILGKMNTAIIGGYAYFDMPNIDFQVSNLLYLK